MIILFAVCVALASCGTGTTAEASKTDSTVVADTACCVKADTAAVAADTAAAK